MADPLSDADLDAIESRARRLLMAWAFVDMMALARECRRLRAVVVAEPDWHVVEGADDA